MSKIKGTPEPVFEKLSTSEVRRLLEDWILGRIEPATLVDFADQVFVNGIDKPTPESDRYPLYVILDVMSLIFAEPLFRPDGFALLRFIDRSEFDTAAAKAELDDYLNRIATEDRLEIPSQEYGGLPESIDAPSFAKLGGKSQSIE